MIRVNLYGSKSQKTSGSKDSGNAGRGSGNFSGSSGAGGASSSGTMVFEEASLKKDALVHLFVMLLPAIALYVYQVQRIPGLEAQERAQRNELVQLQEENAKNQSIADEAKRFHEEKERLEKQIQAIRKLSDGRMNIVKGLEAIQEGIPSKIWVNSLALIDDRIVIEGTALTDLDISSFMERIASSSHLSDPDLLEAEQRNSELVGPVKDFSVNALLEGGI